MHYIPPLLAEKALLSLLITTHRIHTAPPHSASGDNVSGSASAKGGNPSLSGLSARTPVTSDNPEAPGLTAVATDVTPSADRSNKSGSAPASIPSAGIIEPAVPPMNASESGVSADEAADYVEEE